MLHTGLAALGTAAAMSNIYISTEKHKERQRDVREGYLSPSDARHKERVSLALDLLSLGAGIISANSAINGWEKTKEMQHDEEERKERWNHFDRQRKQRTIGY